MPQEENKVSIYWSMFHHGRSSMPQLCPSCSPATSMVNTCSIVVVHGLNGHYKRSWTHPADGMMWLTDLLPLDIPSARVMSFGWDGRVVGSDQPSCLRDWAIQLETQLTDRRSNPNAAGKPIVFVAHSVGGFITKQLLVNSRISSIQTTNNIASSTSAMVFFGTPHWGSKFASTARTWAKTSSVIPPAGTSKKLLFELKDLDFQVYLNRDFCNALHKSQIEIHNLYETRKTRTGIRSSIVVPQDSSFLGYPIEYLVGLAATHGQLPRFASRDDPGYIHVVEAIARAVKRYNNQTAQPPHAEPYSTFSANGSVVGIVDGPGKTRRQKPPVRGGQGARVAGNQAVVTRTEMSSIGREPVTRPTFDTIAGLDAAEMASVFAEAWFDRLRDKVHRTTEERRKDSDKRIKVAIIDSGVDRTHPMLKRFFDSGQITTKSFIDGDPSTSDVCGHGTHMVDLVLRVAPNAHIFMAKVFLSGQSTEMDRSHDAIAKAIRHSTHVEGADIISMSWGYQKEVPEISGAIRDAFRHNKILIAAASNLGCLSKESVAFPANLRQVICINSTDGHGNPSEFNPSPFPDRTFAVIGEGLSVACPLKLGNSSRVIRGTSAAAAVASGTATLILQYSRQKANAGEMIKRPDRLNHCDSIRKVFYIMANDRLGYHVLDPATIFDEFGPDRHYRISRRMSGILDVL